MSRDIGAGFLGEWTVAEFAYGPNGAWLGTISQERRLTEVPGSDELLVTQTCVPSLELAGHSLARFSGDFMFRLARVGRHRRYLGPDVLGGATAFGEGFLCGSGVWPRFGFNFRSWSISTGPHRQLTGGVFFRGWETVAVILGIGQASQARVAEVSRSAMDHPFRVAAGQGELTTLDLEAGRTTVSLLQRQGQNPFRWNEWGEGFEERYELEAVGDDEAIAYRLIRNGQATGMARTYGPQFLWELHDPQGDAVAGMEVLDPASGEVVGLRQHYSNGRLRMLQGLRLTLKEGVS